MSSRFIKHRPVSNASWTARRIFDGMNLDFEMEIEYPLTSLDFYIKRQVQKTAFFLDGPPHLKPRRSERDSLVNQVLRFDGWNVVRFPYKPSGPDGLSKRDQQKLKEMIKNEL